MKRALKSLSIIVMLCLFFAQGNTQQKSTESLNALLPEVFKSYSSQRKRSIQTKLKEMGFYKSPIDGAFDRDTQRAIQDFISRFHYDLISDGLMFQGGISRIDGFRRLNEIFEDILTSEKKDIEAKIELAQQKAAEKEAQEAEAKRLAELEAKLEAEKEAQEAEAKRLAELEAEKEAQEAEAKRLATDLNYAFQKGKELWQERQLTDALDIWSILKSEGSVEIQTEIGKLLEFGIESEYKNQPEAIPWYLLAAKKGYPPAEFQLGSLYKDNADYSKAFRWFLSAASKGHLDAEFEIGLAYELGHGTEQNLPLALQWLKKAAKNGDREQQLGGRNNFNSVLAQNKIGDIYKNGRGTEKNSIEAFKWYKLASNSNYQEAQINIGQIYEYGNGVDQDNSLAYIWYKVSMSNGRAFKSKPFLENIIKKMSSNDIKLANNKIQYCEFPNYASCNVCEDSNLKKLKKNGKKIIFQDGEKAINYLELPALCGDLDALNHMGIAAYYLGNSKQDPKFYTQAFEYWKQGMASRDAESTSNISNLYCGGKGVRQNIKKCKELQRRAIEMGSKNAAYNLGTSYLLGKDGLPKDDVMAYMWHYISDIWDQLQWLEEEYLTRAEVVTAREMALKCVSSGYKNCGWE